MKGSQEDSLDYVNNHEVKDRSFKERLVQEDCSTREETGESLPNIAKFYVSSKTGYSSGKIETFHTDLLQ